MPIVQNSVVSGRAKRPHFAARLFLGVIFCASVFGAESGPEHDLTVTFPRGERRWAELTPLTDLDQGLLVNLAQRDETAVFTKLRPGHYMLCSGADGVAPDCFPIEIDGPTTAGADPGVGLEVKGECYYGRTPSHNARISLIPAALHFKREFTLPLRLDVQTLHLERAITTDKDGLFTLPATAAGEYRLQIVLDHGQTFTTDAFRVTDREGGRGRSPRELILDLGRITIEEGVDVEVFVRDEEGDPIVDARVSAAQGALTAMAEGDVQIFSATTSRDGTSLLRGLQIDQRTIFQCSAEGFEGSPKDVFDEPPLNWECILRRNATVTGSVLDPDGYAIPGATIALKGGTRTTRTDTAGEFVLMQLKPGSNELIVAARGFDSHRAPVLLEAGETRRLPPIRLSEAMQFYGLVTNYRLGTPVPGATVVSRVPPALVQTTADREGRFVVSVGADYELEVEAEGYVPVRVSGETLKGSSEDNPSEIPLSKGGRVHVMAWDDATGAQCVGCSVAIVPLAPVASGGDSLITNSEGEALSKALAPGRYGVGLERVRSLGTLVTVSGGGDLKGVNVPAGETVSIELGRARRTVRIRTLPLLHHSWRLRLSGQRENQVVTADADGLFTFLRDQREKYLVALVDAYSATQVTVGTLLPNDDRPEISLPIAQTVVQGILPTPGEKGIHQIHIASISESSQALTTTTGDGTFRVPYLPPGSYQLMVDRQPITTFLLRDHESLELGVLRLP
ncbi:MAG: carboxypeptidase-like regulatory domain-containing protein [Gammaproteobacteria bacterium]